MPRQIGKRAKRREIIIDYVTTSQEYMETIKSMEIDEEKQYRLYKIERQNKQRKETYSGYNAILI